MSAERRCKASCRLEVEADGRILPRIPLEMIRGDVEVGGMPGAGCLTASRAMTMCKSKKWRRYLVGHSPTETATFEDSICHDARPSLYPYDRLPIRKPTVEASPRTSHKGRLLPVSFKLRHYRVVQYLDCFLESISGISYSIKIAMSHNNNLLQIAT